MKLELKCSIEVEGERMYLFEGGKKWSVFVINLYLEIVKQDQFSKN